MIELEMNCLLTPLEMILFETLLAAVNWYYQSSTHCNAASNSTRCKCMTFLMMQLQMSMRPSINNFGVGHSREAMCVQYKTKHDSMLNHEQASRLCLCKVDWPASTIMTPAPAPPPKV